MKLSHDITLELATGRSRKETNWKNREMLWSALVEKLSVTHRTAETLPEYNAAKKTRQDEIKDIGGFVGGYLSSGRRKSGNVVHRQLITLDLDFAKPGFWDSFTLLFDIAACMYSTHKHSPEAPRLRLIIPLDRPVYADEYVAISRRIAGQLGIELFDHTTFEPVRLMYWPSTAKDAEFLFQYQDGPFLSADSILKTYHNWADSSEWPVAAQESATITRAIKKQGDPLEKPGIVGAWCRTYSIHEAIEVYLADIYEHTADPNRYTYKEGSTAGGLVVYEDKYAYSHHGTDPLNNGHVHNAFDLVRLHKFGLKDEDVAEGTKVNSLPSYKDMTALASSDPRVVQIRAEEMLQEAKADFEGIDTEDEASEEDNLEWVSQLKIDGKGNFLSTIDNIVVIIENDPLLKNRLFLNEFEGRLIVTKNLPWRKVTPQTRDFTDDDSDCLAHYLESQKMPFTYIPKALAKIRTKFQIHPVRSYLQAQRWDGKHRLDTIFTDFLGAEDSPYTRAVARKSFVAAVARVFHPGVKFDNVPTLVGEEGIGKSTLIAKMAGEWFSDCLGDLHGKEGMESLRGVWIMEVAELSALRKADQEAIKRFMSSREDVYRPAYGHQLVRFPRQCVFFATTNKFDFLIGAHVHRRFWPVKTHVTAPEMSVFTDLTPEFIGQYWAEAMMYYKVGEPLNLSEEIVKAAALIREEHREIDDREGIVEKYLNTKLPTNWADMNLFERRAYIADEDNMAAAGTVVRGQVCVAEIWCEALGCMQRDMTSQNTKYIHDIMKKMKGWELAKHPRAFSLYGRQRAYLNIETGGINQEVFAAGDEVVATPF